MQQSIGLRRFLASLDHAPDPRNLAWDTQAVEALSPDERLIAEDALIARASSHGDLRSIKSLALLGVSRALPTLEALRQSGSGMVSHAAARSIALLNGDQRVMAGLIDAMGGQIDAFTAWDLKSMTGKEAFRGLLVALQSADLPARMHALDGLAAKCGVEHLRSPRQSPMKRYELLLGSNSPSLYSPAARSLADIFTQLEAGVTPQALDLVYVPSQDAEVGERFWSSCGSTGRPYAMDLLPDMSSHDKAWALALVVCRVEEADPRSLDAIQHEKLTWSVPLLEECATRPDLFEAEFQAQIQDTLKVLAA